VVATVVLGDLVAQPRGALLDVAVGHPRTVSTG
jgi:hypothetical protein